MRQEPDPGPSQQPNDSPRPTGNSGPSPASFPPGDLHSHPIEEPSGEFGGRDGRLADGLGELFAGATPPESLKSTLMAEAERRFGAAEAPAAMRPRFSLLRGAALASGLAAAAAALFMVLKNPSDQPAPQGGVVATLNPEQAPPADARDVDQSGTVDIFDAYLVARAVEKAESTAGMPDLDEDGRITRADADRIARYAVEVAR